MTNQLAYNRQGSGFPFVLVHGYLAGAAIWDNQIDHFKDYFDVIVPNLPGFGQSASVDAPNSIEEFASLLLEELTQLGVKLSPPWPFDGRHDRSNNGCSGPRPR